MKSRNLTRDNVDFLIEVRLKDSEGLLRELNGIKDVIWINVSSGSVSSPAVIQMGSV